MKRSDDYPPANFGPNETRRNCPGCGSPYSDVYGVKREGESVTIRYRSCRKCPNRWTTVDEVKM